MGRKLVVEVLSANNLMPRDGHGSAHAYCMVEFDGQQQTTKTKNKDLNPVWNEKLEFQVRDPSCMAMETLKIEVLSENQKDKINRKKDAFLGKLSISGSCFKKQGEEAIVAYQLQKKGLLSHVKGELRLKIYYVDEAPKKDGDGGKKKEGEGKKDGDGGKKDGDGGKKDDDGKKEKAAPPPPTVVPASDFVLKETAPVIATGEKTKTYDLVERMQYLFVRIVKGRGLSKDEPFVVVKFGEAQLAKKKAVKKAEKLVEWEEVFAFGKERIQGPTLEVLVAEDEKGSKDLGCVVFELSDVADSPLAPQWYALEDKKTRSRKEDGGEIMLAVWWGTQADESFPGAWPSDTGGFAHTKAQVYVSPTLWYLRVNVIEAQDLVLSDKSRFPDVSVKVQLGWQMKRTQVAKNRSTSPIWNQSLLFVAAEPFEEQLVVAVEDRVAANKEELLGIVKIPLSGNNQITRRLDPGKDATSSHWYNLEKNGDKGFKGRIHLKLYFEGGYHVMDESTNYISDTRPTAKQLWKKSVGVLEVGILQAKSLLPMKTKDGRGTTDAYCVAKYGPKWVRTRTVVDSLNPRWNEQYTWEVYDPCTVVTICVFDNCHVAGGGNGNRDGRIGKVRVRLSTLESDKVYANSYPLTVLQPSGVKKTGELELTVRFSSSALVNVLQVYFQPQLPPAHYKHPLAPPEQELLRVDAIRMVSGWLMRAEPPLRPEVIQYVLDTKDTEDMQYPAPLIISSRPLMAAPSSARAP